MRESKGDRGEGPLVCIVIGASGGVGAELSRRLAVGGAELVLAARNEEPLSALSEELGCVSRPLDATDPATVDACVADAIERFGRLDGIVNCAGSILLKPAHLTSLAEFRATIDANLVTAFNVVHSATAAMRATGGSIVLVSSAAARIGLANHEAVAAAKAGVEGLVRAAAATYAASGIRVNAVAPGLVETPLTARITGSEAGRKASLALHPVGRLGVPSDVATAITWFLDPSNDWVTGQVIGVDGGLGSLKVVAR